MHRFLRRLLLPTGLILVVAAPGVAFADDPPGTHVTLGDNKGNTSFSGTVTTDPGGATVSASGQQSLPASSAPASGPAPAPAGPQTPVGAPPSNTADPPASAPAAPTGTMIVSIPFQIDPPNYGLTQPLAGTLTFPQSNFPVQAPPPSGNAGPAAPGVAVSPREVAVAMLARIPLPAITLRANPSLGLVHLPAWFWVEGYDGRPFGATASVSLPPEVGPEVPAAVVPLSDPRRQASSFTVEVRLWPARCTWSFGDGQSLSGSSLGKAYPAESDIQHTYEYSSLASPDGFPLGLTVEFGVEYRVNGGAAQALPPIVRTYTGRLRVQEAQPVLTSP